MVPGNWTGQHLPENTEVAGAVIGPCPRMQSSITGTVQITTGPPLADGGATISRTPWGVPRIGGLGDNTSWRYLMNKPRSIAVALGLLWAASVLGGSGGLLQIVAVAE